MPPETAPQHKTFTVADLKATGPASGGRFEAIVSVFGNVDKGGDRVLQGAFVDTLKSPEEGGRGFPPIVWTHLWGVVPVGVPQKAEEVEGVETPRGKVDGLFIDGELFVDEHQTAKEVYTAMSRKGGDGLAALREFSFGYGVKAALTARDKEFEPITPAHKRDLVKLDLYEVGPTLVGMNDLTALLGTKTGDMPLFDLLLKAGARNSGDDAERLQSIHDLAVENGASCDGKALARLQAAPDLLVKHLGDAAAKVAAGVTAVVERKLYTDVDYYAIWLLSDMIAAGTSFVSNEEDPADVERMKQILLLLGDMLLAELEEIGAEDDGTASRPGSQTKVRPPRAGDVGELLLAFPTHGV